MSHKYAKVAIVLAIIVVIAFAAPALAKKGPPVVESTNNLSFPAIAADIAAGTAPIVDKPELFSVPYTGDYPGLTAEEIAILVATGPWYAQKVTGNTWNAEFYNALAADTVEVYGVDWGDNIESVSPAVGRPYRLETGLFADRTLDPMTGYTMVMLGNPSSPDEIQGTKATALYDSYYATITSKLPGLRIQRIEGITAALSWDSDLNYWVTPDGAIAGTTTTIAFAPELNVAGKYIFGASTGGWKPTALGKYRITFFIPAASQIQMVDGMTSIGNLVGGAWVSGLAGEGGAEPQLLAAQNLTYVDVTVIGKGGGGKH
jgi:hypothetical protein